ncbi:DUF4229 domain-containing protein [Planosporangium flavigriseum]|uniref:DUF4229 domain-containing protein n=1 Tax=Planosporangium flavigriseum TaxID=373681 RepID=A0A8J3PLJ1_9ACTN|nr:DUF4229 domain-containing protein [Planosporangium flavigriseum]GIG73877.1 hypothetical protein Pfl04_22810 [Planosporangium flavigriseum]
MLKYSLARVGLFVVVAAILIAVPIQLNPLLKLMIAVIVSALLALFLLRGMRDQVAQQMAGTAQRRADEKARLRSALAGDGDRAETVEDRKDGEERKGTDTP